MASHNYILKTVVQRKKITSRKILITKQQIRNNFNLPCIPKFFGIFYSRNDVGFIIYDMLSVDPLFFACFLGKIKILHWLLSDELVENK